VRKQIRGGVKSKDRRPQVNLDGGGILSRSGWNGEIVTILGWTWWAESEIQWLKFYKAH